MSHFTKGEVFTDIVLDVFKLNGLLTVEGDRLTKEVGLTSARWKVLGALSITAKPMTVAQIANKMGQSRQGVQRLVNELEDEKIIAFRDNPQHKRAKLIILTSKGKKIYKQLNNIQKPWANSLVKGYKIKDLKIPPGMPWYNGALESGNRDLKHAIMTEAFYGSCDNIEITKQGVSRKKILALPKEVL